MNKLILISLTLLLLVGCGEKTSDDKIDVSFWQFWTSPDVKPTVDSLINEFETQNPGIDVELVDMTWSDGHEKIVVAFSTGRGPDVVELGSDWINEFASNGILADAFDIFEEFGSGLAMWESAEYNGSYYAVPWLLGTRVLYTNASLLNKAGVDPAGSPRNWAELLQYSEAISELGEPYFGFGSNSAERHRLYKKFLPILWSNDGEVLRDGSCSLTSDEAVAALEYYVKLSDNGYIATQRELDDKFMSGELGFVITGDWMLNRIEKSKPAFDIVTSVVPPPDSTRKSVSFAGGEYLAVNARSANREASKKLIRFLTEASANRAFADAVGSPTPANIEAGSGAIDTLARAFTQQIRTSRMTPVHRDWVYIEELLEKAIEKAVYHKASPRDALNKACKEIDIILSQSR